jgi:NAD(P)-dependent dehydrogenase (short-subunit alcohol dehydrogenase family)
MADWCTPKSRSGAASIVRIESSAISSAVNISIGSVAGLQPGRRIPAYDAGKAGIIRLSRHLALERASRGIRLLIDTPLGCAAGPAVAYPHPRAARGTAWEVASAEELCA